MYMYNVHIHVHVLVMTKLGILYLIIHTNNFISLSMMLKVIPDALLEVVLVIISCILVLQMVLLKTMMNFHHVQIMQYYRFWKQSQTVSQVHCYSLYVCTCIKNAP